MIATDPAPYYPTLRPLGTTLYCRFVRPPERTESGIWLPDETRQNTWHLEVLAAGPGPRRGSLGLEPGTHVLIPKHAYVPVNKLEARVRAEDVLASIYQDEDGRPALVPENDLLLIERDEAEARTRGGLILPEVARRRARRGRVVEAGPGRLRLTGILAGERVSCYSIANLPNDYSLLGRVVYWPEHNADSFEVVSNGRSMWLIRASDLIAAEFPEEHPS